MLLSLAAFGLGWVVGFFGRSGRYAGNVGTAVVLAVVALLLGALASFLIAEWTGWTPLAGMMGGAAGVGAYASVRRGPERPADEEPVETKPPPAEGGYRDPGTGRIRPVR